MSGEAESHHHHHHHHLEVTVHGLERWYHDALARFGMIAVDHHMKCTGHRLQALAYAVNLWRLRKAIHHKMHHVSKCHDKLVHADLKIMSHKLDALIEVIMGHFKIHHSELAQHLEEAVEAVEAVAATVSSLRASGVTSSRAALRASLGRSGRSPTRYSPAYDEDVYDPSASGY